MWDLRRLVNIFSATFKTKVEKIFRNCQVEPTHTLNIGSKQLHTVSWCPTRSGIIATAAKDDACIRLWDLKVGNILAQFQKFRIIFIFHWYRSELRCHAAHQPKVSVRLSVPPQRQSTCILRHFRYDSFTSILFFSNVCVACAFFWNVCVDYTRTIRLTPRVVSTREAVSAFCWHNTVIRFRSNQICFRSNET